MSAMNQRLLNASYAELEQMERGVKTANRLRGNEFMLPVIEGERVEIGWATNGMPMQKVEFYQKVAMAEVEARRMGREKLASQKHKKSLSAKDAIQARREQDALRKAEPKPTSAPTPPAAPAKQPRSEAELKQAIQKRVAEKREAAEKVKGLTPKGRRALKPIDLVPQHGPFRTPGKYIEQDGLRSKREHYLNEVGADTQSKRNKIDSALRRYNRDSEFVKDKQVKARVLRGNIVSARSSAQQTKASPPPTQPSAPKAEPKLSPPPTQPSPEMKAAIRGRVEGQPSASSSAPSPAPASSSAPAPAPKPKPQPIPTEWKEEAAKQTRTPTPSPKDGGGGGVSGGGSGSSRVMQFLRKHKKSLAVGGGALALGGLGTGLALAARRRVSAEEQKRG